MNDDEPSPDPSLTETARDWLVRLSSGEIEESELETYRQWAADPKHQTVFQHELALWRNLNAIGDRLAPQTPLPPNKQHRRGLTGAAIAVSIAVMLIAPEAALRIRADHRTGLAVQSVLLPDGSRAVLDAGTAIAVRYDAAERRVDLLRGRAWFDVAHGNPAPFRVAINGGVVEDVGTAFAVSWDGGKAEAAVTGGEVRILSPEHSRSGLALRAGQRARWVDGEAATRIGDLPLMRIAAWRDGDILLDSVPVREAVREVGRYRAGPTFIMGAVDALPPVTTIVRADRADEGLEALAASTRLQILRLPGDIAIVRPTS